MGYRLDSKQGGSCEDETLEGAQVREGPPGPSARPGWGHNRWRGGRADVDRAEPAHAAPAGGLRADA
jgi:hypothetical protein